MKSYTSKSSGTCLVFKETFTGLDISALSLYDVEDEVLFFPGSMFVFVEDKSFQGKFTELGPVQIVIASEHHSSMTPTSASGTTTVNTPLTTSTTTTTTTTATTATTTSTTITTASTTKTAPDSKEQPEPVSGQGSGLSSLITTMKSLFKKKPQQPKKSHSLKTWTAEEVVNFISDIPSGSPFIKNTLKEYASLFEEVDGAMLCTMNRYDFDDLGVGARSAGWLVEELKKFPEYTGERD